MRDQTRLIVAGLALRRNDGAIVRVVLPLDWHQLLGQCVQQQFVHRADGNDGQAALHIVGDFGQILFILLRIKTLLSPPRNAASNFSLRPPIGKTRPRSVISPVMAMSRRTGMPLNTDTIEVTIATPADGPSLGVAPSGTWTWISLRSNMVGEMPNTWLRDLT